MSKRHENEETITAPLLDYTYSDAPSKYIVEEDDDGDEKNLSQRVWIETQKLWRVVGPAIFSRVASYSMFVITQAFAGHLGDLELAGMSIASNVIMGFDFGLMLNNVTGVNFRDADSETPRPAGRRGGAVGRGGAVFHPSPLQLRDSVSAAEISAEPIEKQRDCVGQFGGACGARAFELVGCVQAEIGGGGDRAHAECVVVVGGFGVVFVYCLRRVSAHVDGVFRRGVFGVVGFFEAVGVFRRHAMLGKLVLQDSYSDDWKSQERQNCSGCLVHLIKVFYVFFTVRVANELGAGNGKGAKFATIVSVTQSILIGLVFWVLIMFFHNEVALIYTSSKIVLEAVSKLSILLAFTVLLNSVQPILSGVAVGSGWQSYVAYINLGCYYLIGLPLGVLMGWVFHQGVMGIWAGMIFGGTAVQTAILAIITMRCDWEMEAAKATQHVRKWSESRNNA
ncbi:hypothetical protein DH2020_031231 [Rehmannia glutinosa]|uniref:Protein DETOXIFICATION n=1 Tax=Rehmannia glutinosa TaxID=99300 RepID=A0ABR0VM14_REHGL